MNSVAWVYLPYLAFTALVIGGLYYDNTWVVIMGLVFLYAYDPKPELEIICKRTIYNNCTFEKIKKEQSK